MRAILLTPSTRLSILTTRRDAVTVQSYPNTVILAKTAGITVSDEPVTDDMITIITQRLTLTTVKCSCFLHTLHLMCCTKSHLCNASTSWFFLAHMTLTITLRSQLLQPMAHQLYSIIFTKNIHNIHTVSHLYFMPLLTLGGESIMFSSCLPTAPSHLLTLISHEALLNGQIS